MKRFASYRSVFAVLFSAALLLPGPAHAADQLVRAPATDQVLKPFDGQPLWSVLVRCSIGHYRLSEQAKHDLVGPAEEAAARANGTTVQAQRDFVITDNLKRAGEFRDKAVAVIIADRSISQQQALEAIRGQITQLQPIEDNIFDRPCRHLLPPS